MHLINKVLSQEFLKLTIQTSNHLSSHEGLNSKYFKSIHVQPGFQNNKM